MQQLDRAVEVSAHYRNADLGAVDTSEDVRIEVGDGRFRGFEIALREEGIRFLAYDVGLIRRDRDGAVVHFARAGVIAPTAEAARG